LWTISGVDSRELYVAVSGLADAHEHDVRPLEDFLRALRAALEPSYPGPGLTPEQLLEVLGSAFTAPVPPRDPGWRDSDLSEREGPVDAAAVDRLLRSQILDLEDAAAAGALTDEWRYLGLEIPRPEDARRATSPYYYNWDPRTYVECGVAGAFDGWEPGDPSGRVLVPGEVLVLDDDGFRSVPAEEARRPVVDLPLLSWAQVHDFLWCGQNYE
jgi:hypothetical protein